MPPTGGGELCEHIGPALGHISCIASCKMAEHRRLECSPFDEGKLRVVREFLRREFRECQHRDYFAFDQSAQVFVVETERSVRHTLVIPKATFEAADFPALCNVQLGDTLRLAREGRVTLTPRGLDVPP